MPETKGHLNLNIRLLSSVKRRKSHLLTALCLSFILMIPFSTTIKNSGRIAARKIRFSEDEVSSYQTQFPIRNAKVSSSNCELSWRSAKFSDKFYEEAEYNNTYLHRKDFFTLPHRTQPVYQNVLINLDPDKFLLPILVNGPNNQITGLREAAFVSIKLNRTLVIPKFFKHFTDSQADGFKYSFIYPGHRFEVDALCTFMSCITLEQLQDACGRKIDSALSLRRYSDHDLKKFESYAGMRITRDDENHFLANFSIKLVPRFGFSKEEKFRKFGPEEIQSLFHTNDRCVAYPYPLYNLHFSGEILKSSKKTINKPISSVEESSYGDVFYSVNLYSRAPDYISKIAEDFISSKMNARPFVSVHWRYNKNDFMKRCGAGKNGDRLKMSLCENALRIQPEDIAEAIREKIMKLKTKTGILIQDTYIAMPASQGSMVLSVADTLRQKQNGNTYSSSDLEKFLRDRYSSCAVLQSHFNDIISTTEMEICGRGLLFLGSARSSWSANVFLSRENRRSEYDGDIFMAAVDVLDRRTHLA